MGSLKSGAEQAVKKCLKVKKGEKVVIVADFGSTKIAKAIAKVVEDVKGVMLNVHILEEYGKRPLKKLPKAIENDVKKSKVIFSGDPYK